MVYIVLAILVFGTLLYNSLGNIGWESSITLKNLRSKDFFLGISSFTSCEEDVTVDTVAFGFFLFSIEIGFYKPYPQEEA